MNVLQSIPSLTYPNILLWVLVLLPIWTFAQHRVTVIDDRTSAPLAYANLKLSPISKVKDPVAIYRATNLDGSIDFPPYDSLKIEISYIGFKPKTIYTNTTKDIHVKLVPKAEYMEELIITSGFMPIKKEKALFPIKTIKKLEITEKGATNLRELIQQAINFRTNNGHANETAININGLSGNYVKFLIDGVAIEGRLDGNVDLSQINLQNIEKIEIIEGPSSITYGTNALGGVINLITKKTQSTPLHVHLNSYYESVGQYNINGDIGYKNNGNLFKISAGRNFFNGYAKHDINRSKVWKPREQYFGSLLYTRRIHQLDFTYILDGFHELMTSRGVPIGPYNVTAFDTYFNSIRWSNKLLLKGQVSKLNYWDFTASQSYYQRRRNIYFKDLVSTKRILVKDENSQDTTLFHSYMARAVYNRKQGDSNWAFLVGAAYKSDHIMAQRIINQVQSISEIAIFTNISYIPSEHLKIQPAIRYAYNTKYKAPIIPSVNIWTSISDELQLRASYAKGFRTPTLKELFIEFHLNTSINLFGNESLEAEQSDHWNISMDYHPTRGNHQWSIQAKLYYTKIKNLIQLVRVSPINWQYKNLANLVSKGTSLTIQHQWKSLKLHSSILHYTNQQSIFDQEENHKYTTDFVGSINYTLDAPQVSLNLNYKYTDEVQNYYLDDNHQIQPSSIGSYHTLDLSTTKYFLNKKHQITIGAKNLFDVTTVELKGDITGVSSSKDATALDVLWGRSFFINIESHF